MIKYYLFSIIIILLLLTTGFTNEDSTCTILATWEAPSYHGSTSTCAENITFPLTIFEKNDLIYDVYYKTNIENDWNLVTTEKLDYQITGVCGSTINCYVCSRFISRPLSNICCTDVLSVTLLPQTPGCVSNFTLISKVN